MTDTLKERLFRELDAIRLLDSHSHIEPLSAASNGLADLLDYHYYTELAHSAGMPHRELEEPGISPREKVRRIVARLAPVRNTIQYAWMLELCGEFFGLPPGEDLTPENCDALFDSAAERCASAGWEKLVAERTGLDGVLLTNAFDDPLAGFDTCFYIPCLRTDDLVFKLHLSEVRTRLAGVTGVDVSDAATLRDAVARLVRRFVEHQARACAISLPPGFTPGPVADASFNAALDRARRGDDTPEAVETVANFVFWAITEQCEAAGLPFDLMIGVNRNVYPGGVLQGRDLFDSRVSLYQYRELFNAFPAVTFPVSVLASAVNQELVSYAWIFPNVVAHGHWWYSNTPSYIELDAAARLEAAPANKQIGYYSDAYKLEFILPKFRMYKRVLAGILAERFVVGRRWSETRALELARQVLRGNVDSVFPSPKAGKSA